MKRALLYIFLLIIPLSVQAQELDPLMRYIVQGKDTIFLGEIPPAYITNKKKPKKDKAWRDYYRLVHNFAKAYPYALVAKEEMNAAQAHLDTTKMTKRQRERYLAGLEDLLFKTFEKPLRKLTVNQGQLLLRLIDRETGLSSYYIIKNYRGSAAALFWQSIAKIFSSDLKRPYDKFGEDKLTEGLVKIYQSGNFDLLYLSIFGNYPPPPAVSPKKDYPQAR